MNLSKIVMKKKVSLQTPYSGKNLEVRPLNQFLGDSPSNHQLTESIFRGEWRSSE
jgi:hypothetical protein